MTTFRRHTVYRLYSLEGELIYVGVTSNIAQRFAQHNLDKPWWSEVAYCTFEHWGNRISAMHAEKRAIQEGRPRINVRHNSPHMFIDRRSKAELEARSTDEPTEAAS